uniref:inositol-trisphosphate 3-kinase A-like isoform X1 n=1 Tax=Styela clava TaxID=7725 RepID=UPI001939D186|nr:inositol-trisphosphate 3-kinase A-like isoform X1 [Styela clava]
MDSASDPSGRVDDSEFCYQENSSSLLSPDNKSPDIKSISSSSSSSSSPSHPALATSVTSNDSTLRVMSEYGLQRKLSSSSGSSFRSSLSFEESEDDMLSSDGESFREHAVHKGRRQSKAQSSWTKIRRMVIWSPFMQSFKKKYPWVQLAGHAGNFQPGEEGCILKKFCSREADCLNKLSTDNALRPFAPEYHGIVEKEGEKYTRMQDLLLAYDCPSVMDCKMGVRTYLEDELVKAKIKPRLRHDMYAKMTEIAPEEPTQEEHEQRAVTKPRYMQWREHVSSSSNLGFRIEGIKKADNDPSKDYKLTKTKEQVKNAFKYFIDDNIDVLEKYIKRLKDVRDAAEKSEFFMSHEVIGSSLLFVHDKTGIASAWMIDFGKTSQLPDNKKLTHREEWIEGNREDGYLFGLDNLIGIFEEICKELMSDSVNIIQSTEVNGNQEPTSNDVNESDNNEQSRLPGSPLTLTLSSQSSAESVESSSSQPQDGPTDDIASTQNNTKENTRKPPLKRQTASSEPDACHQPTLATDPVTDNITNDAKNVNTDVANGSVGTINDIKDDSHLDESRGPGTT